MSSLPFQKDDRLKRIGFPDQCSAEQGFLLSRLEQPTKVSDLLPLCPWPESQTLDVLKSLIQKNCIDIDTPSKPVPPQEQKTDRELSWMSEDLQKNIHEKFDNLSQLNPYEILECRKIATSGEIKQSYLKLSRRFHPDRFFRKPLGPYKTKLNAIFEAIQKAYSQLRDPHEREIIDRKIRTQAKLEAKSTTTPTKKKKKLDPLVEKIGKAESFFKDGIRAEKEGNYAAAANAYQLALQTNSQKKMYQEAHERVLPYIHKQKAGELLENAKKSQEVGMYEEVLDYAEKALKHLPESAEANFLVAKAILETRDKERFSDAKEMLLRAKVGMPQSGDPCVQLGRLFQFQNEKEQALKSYKEALKRDPQNRQAQKLLDKLS